MPIYAYRCAACGHAKDVLQKISDAPLSTCPACGAETFRKQLTAAGFQLKGSGWYATDFKGGAKPADKPTDDVPAADKAPAEKSGGEAPSAPADAGSSAAGKPAGGGAKASSAASTPAVAAASSPSSGNGSSGGASAGR